ncbi:hypothetical protein PoB_003458000 [Plakobranchus ocellatus]|uniref:Uncharacterized protein n=1 Tax=Plakobranchus ocellatus TaxID=259542 RepID=A0AAV4AL37_9GAST|nr:hypothetical protein PoB_003458000 [Plakobranchus ocellatus]
MMAKGWPKEQKFSCERKATGEHQVRLVWLRQKPCGAVMNDADSDTSNSVTHGMTSNSVAHGMWRHDEKKEHTHMKMSFNLKQLCSLSSLYAES